MAEVSMRQVKELRDKTHVGMMDCKKALIQAEGDIEKAIEFLRKKGAKVAAKRSGKATNEGVIATYISSDMRHGSLVEIACETDFAANTSTIQTFAHNVAESADQVGLGDAPVEELMKKPYSGATGVTISQALNDLIAQITENIKVAYVAHFSLHTNGIIQSYLHPGAHLGVMIELETDKPADAKQNELASLGKDICMQIAVTNPFCVEPTQLDPAILKKERAFYREQLEQAGKPAQMIDKILEGKMSKYYEEVCLLNQKFIKNDKTSIQQHVNEIAGKLGLKVTVKRYVRFKIG